MFPKGFQITVKSVIAEDNCAAVEAESIGEIAVGKIYNQTYHYLFVVEDGKRTQHQEYLDTYHLKERMVDDFAEALLSSSSQP